jgi:hypothetical protein
VLVQECRIARDEAVLLAFRIYLPDLFVYPCFLAQGRIQHAFAKEYAHKLLTVLDVLALDVNMVPASLA